MTYGTPILTNYPSIQCCGPEKEVWRALEHITHPGHQVFWDRQLSSSTILLNYTKEQGVT